MIKKLRVRFIIAALLSVFFVLAATIVAINVSNYLKSERETNNLLDDVIDRERESLVKQNSWRSDDMMGGGQGGQGGQGGGQGEPGGGQGDVNYKESDPSKDDPRGHYFVTVFGTDDSIWYTNFHIISTDKAADQQMAVDVYKGNKSTGTIGSYRFKKVFKKDIAIREQYTFTTSMAPEIVETEVPIEATYVVFVDTNDAMHSVNNFVVSSIVVAAVSYTVLAGLIIISSHFIFKTSEESYRKQKAFITNASHELKTPLTIINTDVEILKMDHGENEWTDSIRDQVHRLTLMTNQLVTLSKLDEGNMQNYPFSTFSLSELAKNSVDDFSPTYKKNGFSFNSDIDKGLEIKANQHLIDELFYIFLDNALKYTKEKGEINLSVKKNNRNKIEINFSNDIEDNEIDVDQIFERFYRSPNSNKKEGSGIGLSIAKEICDLHKAKITASVKEQKILFVITF